ncbi:hypothetical protein SCLCIDRAFT_72870, partial [Scleroderma citrinum Foug A]
FIELPKNADIRKHKLSKMEWNVLKDFELILEVPHQAIMVLSSECLPTVCKYLAAFKQFYVTWQKI